VTNSLGDTREVMIVGVMIVRRKIIGTMIVRRMIVGTMIVGAMRMIV